VIPGRFYTAKKGLGNEKRGKNKRDISKTIFVVNVYNRPSHNVVV
jgi:hypothetical protein